MSDTNDVTPATPPVKQATDDLPTWVREKLSAANNEAAKYRTERNEYREQATAALNQVTEVTNAKTAAEERAAAAEKELLKYRVALEAGVPGGLIPRLQGSTEEEIRADAAALLEQIGSSIPVKQSATDPSQGKGDGKSAGLSPGAAALFSQLRNL